MKVEKNTQQLISIIMPAYNCEKYISEAVVTVIRQTYVNWELIVIDDGSSDNTTNILKKIENNDDRIQIYLNEENQGVSYTRNKGVSLAKGEWIAFLDSDDLWTAEKLQKQIELVEKEEADFLFTGSSFIDEAGNYFKGTFEVPQYVSYKSLKTHNVISCSSVLLKKKLLKDIKMERDDMHEDYAVWLRILRKGIIAHGVNEPLLIYRISPNSKSGNKLKTVKMTYKVFRFIGYSQVNSTYYMFRHLLGSVKKYRKIKKTL